MATEERLIDASDAIEQLKRSQEKMGVVLGYKAVNIESVIRFIETRPTVDATKVVHAQWIDICFEWRTMLATCSHCRVRGVIRAKSNDCGFAVPDADYCSHCGAKMDGGTI